MVSLWAAIMGSVRASRLKGVVQQCPLPTIKVMAAANAQMDHWEVQDIPVAAWLLVLFTQDRCHTLLDTYSLANYFVIASRPSCGELVNHGHLLA